MPAGICATCSITCHSEHEQVELFSRRHFQCDCGTTRLGEQAVCKYVIVILFFHQLSAICADIHTHSAGKRLGRESNINLPAAAMPS